MHIQGSLTYRAMPTLGQMRGGIRARILIAAPAPRLAQALRGSLLTRRYAVGIAHDADTAGALARGGIYDLLLLNVAAPELDGLALCRGLRAEGCGLPILMLHAHGGMEDLLAGFDAGADSYLLGPSSPELLLAQVHALCRRRYHFRQASA